MRSLTPYPAGPGVLEKIRTKHGLSWFEVAEAFARRPQIYAGYTDSYGERRYAGLGRTAAGRYRLVVFTLPRRGWAKVITARDMTTAERRRFGKRRT